MVSTIKKIGFAVLFTVIGMFSSNVQNENTKVIVLLNKANWCSVCQANGPRVEKDLMPMLMQNKQVQLVVNDLSDKSTKASSQMMLEKAGLASFGKKNNGTGMMYFIDAKSKKLISSIMLSKSNDEIMKVYQDALPKMHGENGHVCTEACKSKM